MTPGWPSRSYVREVLVAAGRTAHGLQVAAGGPTAPLFLDADGPCARAELERLAARTGAPCDKTPHGLHLAFAPDATIRRRVRLSGDKLPGCKHEKPCGMDVLGTDDRGGAGGVASVYYPTALRAVADLPALPDDVRARLPQRRERVPRDAPPCVAPTLTQQGERLGILPKTHKRWLATYSHLSLDELRLVLALLLEQMDAVAARGRSPSPPRSNGRTGPRTAPNARAQSQPWSRSSGSQGPPRPGPRRRRRQRADPSRSGPAPDGLTDPARTPILARRPVRRARARARTSCRGLRAPLSSRAGVRGVARGRGEGGLTGGRRSPKEGKSPRRGLVHAGAVPLSRRDMSLRGTAPPWAARSQPSAHSGAAVDGDGRRGCRTTRRRRR